MLIYENFRRTKCTGNAKSALVMGCSYLFPSTVLVIIEVAGDNSKTTVEKQVNQLVIQRFHVLRSLLSGLLFFGEFDMNHASAFLTSDRSRLRN